MKVALGTAQFGLNYGINNKTGKVPSSEAFEILKLALKSKINLIDTAFVYGDSESIIDCFIKDGNSFKIVSKFARLQKFGIGVHVHYIFVHLQTYYRKNFGYKEDEYPKTEENYKSTITVSLYQKMRLTVMSYIMKNIKETLI